MKNIIINKVGDTTRKLQITFDTNQQELTKEEERLKLTLELSGIGAYDWCPKTDTVIWDARIREIFGYPDSSDEDPIEFYFRVLHPDDLEKSRQFFLEILDSKCKENRITNERRIIRNGEICHIKGNALIFRNEQGEVERIIGSVEDITNNKNRELEIITVTERLNEAQRVAKIGAFETELDGRKIWWSKGVYDILEIDQGQVPPDGLEFLAFVHPDDRDYIIHKTAICIKEKQEINLEYRLQFQDGRIKYMSDVATPIVNSEGRVVKINGISRDITERKLADLALHKSEEQYRTLVENSHDLIWELDIEGNYIFINSMAKEFYGFEPEKMIGTNFTNRITADKLEEARQVFKEMIELGKDVFHYECKVYNRDREVVLLDSHVVVKRNELGEIISVTGISQNITERKKAEAALRKSEERLQLSTRAAEIGIWDWNVKSDLLIWDETMLKIYGLIKGEHPVSSDLWLSRLHPDDRKEIEEKVETALKSETELKMEYRILWPDKSIRYIKEVGAIHRDENGEAIRMFGTNWDVTKEKEAEQQEIRARQLEVRNQELEQFAYVASHDLKEPLRTVKSFSEIIKQRYEDRLDEDANKYLGFISQAASRMDLVIKALLDYSRIGQQSEVSKINCNHIVNDVLRDLSVQIKETNVCSIFAILPSINGHAIEMRMLFQNLISNAIKFRHEERQPIIRLSAEKKSMHWEFCIRDNGIGMDSSYYQKIFELFQRLHARDEFEGTGIGLAHCKKILDLHHGEIWVESTIGEGSAFYFTIPVE